MEADVLSFAGFDPGIGGKGARVGHGAGGSVGRAFQAAEGGCEPGSQFGVHIA